MFKEITEGLALYRKAVEDYVVKCSEIREREESSRQETGDDYYGQLDWTPDDFEWAKKTSAELSGMAKVLGLSAEERERIWQEIYEKIKKQ